MIDLSNSLEWNLVTRVTLTAFEFNPIAPRNVPVSSRQIVIGVKVDDEPTWKWAGWVSQYVFARPSTTADLYPPLTRVLRQRIFLQSYQAIELVPALPENYSCLIEFPPYFRRCHLEVWQRNDI